jgi:hypothetical protein
MLPATRRPAYDGASHACPPKQLPRLSAEQRGKQGGDLGRSGKAQHHVQRAAGVPPEVMADEG